MAGRTAAPAPACSAATAAGASTAGWIAGRHLALLAHEHRDVFLAALLGGMGGNPFNAVDISTIPVAVTVLAEGDPRYDDLEKRLAEGPVIAVPTITLDGDSDGVAPATDGTSHAKKFSGKRTHKIIKGIGHNLPQEAPQAFAEAVVEVER